MTTDKFNVWDQAAQVLNEMSQNHDLNTLEAWALAYAIRCIGRDKEARNSLSRTEQAIRETELALSGSFEVFREEAGQEAVDRHIEIESRR